MNKIVDIVGIKYKYGIGITDNIRTQKELKSIINKYLQKPIKIISPFMI